MERSQLFLLHFAGGNCYSFQFIASMLSDFDVVTLELPGRGRRMEEELLKDFDQAAADIFQQLMDRLVTRKFMIYGHSMGAYLALRVSNMAARCGKAPLYLFVSGNPGPGIRDDKKRYLLESSAFVEELVKLGGMPRELVENREMFEFFEPILRADFEIAERNELAHEPAVSIPLFAIMGSEEENVEKIDNWGRFTNARFDYRILGGDHFFIHKHPHTIAGIIKQSYRYMLG
ncbi:alpha/beta fold hydrolase [Flavitalea sp. BT771]|uniref:thioesterase II family protein n=1 Tax=Flavitalea sp. BT771 TaxID=3063329 RepID=UPI0026E2792E|nr:alpha/beta fold hydrolase [Flavitalea sp. BT771]MDO6434611.1 alpha/beta fold hydrolase [Flavitalea sp. BT771]MDV6223511.1 alpha/beta fold hydrolase [Flavitalea sp. BT771]